MAWPNFGRTGVHSVHVEGGGLQAPVLFSLLAKFQLIVPRLQAACWILGSGQSTSQQVWQVSTRSMNWPNAFCHFPPKRCFGCGPLLFSAWKSVSGESGEGSGSPVLIKVVVEDGRGWRQCSSLAAAWYAVSLDLEKALVGISGRTILFFVPMSSSSSTLLTSDLRPFS